MARLPLLRGRRHRGVLVGCLGNHIPNSRIQEEELAQLEVVAGLHWKLLARRKDAVHFPDNLPFLEAGR